METRYETQSGLPLLLLGVSLALARKCARTFTPAVKHDHVAPNSTIITPAHSPWLQALRRGDTW
jgi:hypothetical protein